MAPRVKLELEVRIVSITFDEIEGTNESHYMAVIKRIKNGIIVSESKNVEGVKEYRVIKAKLDADNFWDEVRKLSLHFKTYRDRTEIKVQGECLTELQKILGENVNLELELLVRKTTTVETETSSYRTKPMSVQTVECRGETKQRKIEPFCEDPEVKLFFETTKNPLHNKLTQISFSLWLTRLSPVLMIDDKDVLDKFQVFGKLLDGRFGSDFTLVASDGMEIQCHKAFLIAHSKVFAAMLESGLEESKTGKFQTDISQKSLKAFLEYLYCFQVFQPYRDPQVALDLLQAAHKYEIKTMETKMKSILLTNPDEIFCPEEAIQLFLFARNVDDFGDLKKKAVQVLRSKVKELKSVKFLAEGTTEAEEDLLLAAFSFDGGHEASV